MTLGDVLRSVESERDYFRDRARGFEQRLEAVAPVIAAARRVLAAESGYGDEEGQLRRRSASSALYAAVQAFDASASS